MKITRLGWTAYAVAVVAVVLDQISKVWILGVLGTAQGSSIHVAGPLNFTMVHNYGMSFGLLRDHAWGRWLLIGFATAVAVGLGIWASKAVRPLVAVGLGLIIAGAVGNNLIDRMIYGYVVDFIDVSAMRFPWVFNVADSWINIGVACLLLDSFIGEEKKLSHQTE
nr:signal peptidase II [Caulobacter hibisci]